MFSGKKIRNSHMRNVKKADRPGIVMEGVGVEMMEEAGMKKVGVGHC